MQGQLNVASVFGADDAQQLQGPDVLADMKELLRLLTICIHFSKKTFPQFLEITEFTRDQVLLEEGRAGVRFTAVNNRFFFKSVLYNGLFCCSSFAEY